MVGQTPVDSGKGLYETIDQVNILFKAGLRAYDSSEERSRHCDLKASIILAFLGILLLPSLEIFSWSNKLLGLRLAPILLVFLGIVFCLFAILPTIHLKHPPLSVLKRDYDQDKAPINSKIELFVYYKSAAEKNDDVGKRKVKFIQGALASSFFAFVFILVQYVARGWLYGR